MIRYNLTEDLFDELMLNKSIAEYLSKFNATFDWNANTKVGEIGYWGSVIFQREEDLTWFLLNI